MSLCHKTKIIRDDEFIMRRDILTECCSNINFYQQHETFTEKQGLHSIQSPSVKMSSKSPLMCTKTMLLPSEHGVILGDIARECTQRVRFSLPGNLDASFLAKANTDSLEPDVPPFKRRRFGRRNSQTAAMLTFVQQDFNASILSIERPCNSIRSWEEDTDASITMAEVLVQSIKKQQENS